MFLQLKHDLLSGRLQCGDDDVAQLSALALQCQSQIHFFISFFRLIQNNFLKSTDIFRTFPYDVA